MAVLGRGQPVPAVISRGSLADAPVLTTPAPVIIQAAATPGWNAPRPVVTSRGTQDPADLAGRQPLISARQAVPAVPAVPVISSAPLAPPAVATPAPVVVQAAAAAAWGRPQAPVVTRTPAAPAPPVLLRNDLEEGTSGVTLTTGNTGGAGESAFNSISVSGGTNAFASAQAAHGNLSAQIINGTGATYAEWSSSLGSQPQIFGRAYLYLTAAPSADTPVIWFLNAAKTTILARILLRATRAIRISDTASTPILTSATLIPLNQWVRLEFSFSFPGTATGQGEVQIFTGADSGAPDEDLLTAAAQNFGSVNAGAVRFGWNAASSGAAAFFDDLGLSNTAFLGPVGSLPTGDPVVMSTAVTPWGRPQAAVISSAPAAPAPAPQPLVIAAAVKLAASRPPVIVRSPLAGATAGSAPLPVIVAAPVRWPPTFPVIVAAAAGTAPAAYGTSSLSTGTTSPSSAPAAGTGGSAGLTTGTMSPSASPGTGTAGSAGLVAAGSSGNSNLT